ncbi:MAG TPA: shikimate dehydrogenase [Bosea sp. (in: a-proteobacteria)]|uniref:shikimate dehydrogenase n=1 Tax=Bosea sp. (in: a-proteobacteria) TaxID=1871050 RepID=UPI002DDCE0B4|nr:shikimate dehydrogenase [Bosea sp. (in: a-proteobacteria)]HEV2555936.1 shikimate dehydrogenase [Bosea sp. (in: a-proteobacteria)]
MPDIAIANRTKRVLLGLIGTPIAHSAAPAMHESAARAAGFELHYHLIEVAGAGRADLVAILDGVRRMGFSGINVTYPYKEAVVPLLDALSPEARAMGAVNTVVARDGVLTGHNTDATGFATAYRALRRADGDAPVAIIGTGGVGKAIGFALAGCGVTHLRLFDSDRAKAQALADQIGERAQVTICNSVEAAVSGAAGLVNGTPVGMLPNRDSPVPADLIRKSQWVADAVYHPLWTPLLKAAQKAGATVMTGRELSINQAVDAFALFTGVQPPDGAIADAFDRSLAAQEAQHRAA